MQVVAPHRDAGVVDINTGTTASTALSAAIALSYSADHDLTDTLVSTAGNLHIRSTRVWALPCEVDHSFSWHVGVSDET